MLTYEFKIKTTNTLIEKFEQHLGITRLVYNLEGVVKKYIEDQKKV